eukprot:9834-Heterococcus_DN1.PRE.10
MPPIVHAVQNCSIDSMSNATCSSPSKCTSATAAIAATVSQWCTLMQMAQVTNYNACCSQHVATQTVQLQSQYSTALQCTPSVP